MDILNGSEKLISKGISINHTILDFWRWNSSDLLNNTLRGAFAEFIVSAAVGADMSHSHIDWEAYDITGPNGERIEVKCSAYLQSWNVNAEISRFSKPIFSIAPAREWLPDECRYSDQPMSRHSDLYVFCLYTCLEAEIHDPLNLDNWDFYVIATFKLDQIFGSQRSVSLKTLLEKGHPLKCDYDGLKTAIDQEYADHLNHIK